MRLQSNGLAAALATAALAAAATPAFAAQIAVVSYDMPNGDGQAHGGSFNYWDLAYSGAGAKTTDGAPLTGGKGDLTDGVAASDYWFNLENGAGTGPYVGWRHIGTADPTVTFHFAGSPTIGDIKIHMDNSNAGGVIAPSAIWVDGVNRPFTAPALGTIGWVDLAGLNLTGGTHTIQFFQDIGFYPGNPDSWTFISEVSFFGAVPEPASWALMIGGFGLMGAALRRRARPALAR